MTRSMGRSYQYAIKIKKVEKGLVLIYTFITRYLLTFIVSVKVTLEGLSDCRSSESKYLYLTTTLTI